MKYIVKKLFFLLFSIVLFFSKGIAQEFLAPDTENDLDRQSQFIEAQSEIIIGNTDGAIKIYKSLLKKDVNDDEAAFFLGKVYLENEDISNSIKYFSLALSNEKDNPWYYIWAADAYLKNKQFDQATRTTEELVDRFPDEKSYYDRLEFLYQDSKQYEKQLKLLDEILERFGFHKDEALARVQAYENNEQPEEALQALSDLAQRFPRDLFILNMLANYYERNDQDNLALEIYTKILDINPNDSRANLAVVEAKSNSGGTGTEKLMAMKPFFLNSNIDFDTQFREIVPYFQQDLNKLPQEELNALEEVSIWLLQSHPEDPKALSLRADILAQTGQNLKASEYYIKTIEIHPDNYMVWEQLLWSLKELLRWDQLNHFADEASIYFPNKAVIYLLKGEAGYHLERWDDALFDLETCISLSSQDPVMQSNAQGLMALIDCSVDDSKPGQNTFSQAHQILPNNPNIDYYESICLLKNNNFQKSKEFIEKALKKAPDNPSFSVQKAKILFQENNYIESLETLLSLDGKTTFYPVYEWIAQNYIKLNQLENADKYTQMAQEYGAPEIKQIKN